MTHIDSQPGSEPTGPLAGLRVIELSSFVAAPLAGMTLRQLGADVIRVDPPGGAADTDRWPLTASGASLYWAGLNKGKRSLVADVRTAEGRQIIRDALAGSPRGTAVFLTNSPRPGLDYEALSQARPDLIHVEIRGNHDGTPAVDYTVNAATGFPAVTGPTSANSPVNHVLPAWDVACGLYAALGVSAAARRRATDGVGERIRIALSDVALATAGNLGFLAEAEVTGTDRPRIGNHLYGSFARDFRCADGGRIMVVALTPRHWRDLVEVTSIHATVAALEGALGVDFASEGDRYEHRDVLAALVQRWFAQRSVTAASEALQRTSVLWAPYRSFTGVVEDLRTHPGHPMMTVINQPGIGPHFAPSSPLEFGSSHTPAEPAPTLGADTCSILSGELGLTAAEIADLLRRGIVADATDAHRSNRNAR